MHAMHKFWIVTLILTSIWKIKFVFSQVESISYKIHYVSVDPYGDPISTFTVRGILECFAMCTELSECKSTTFTPDLNLCHLNRADVHPQVNPGTCTASCLIKYAAKPPEAQACTMGQSCTSNSDCTVGLGLSCQNSVCACTLGYSFRPTSCDCVTACNTYGTTFAVSPGSKMQSDNTAVHKSVMSAAACQALCAAESTFVCKTAEYKLGSQRCHLQDYTVLQQPTAYVLAAEYDLYIRNCA